MRSQNTKRRKKNLGIIRYVQWTLIERVNHFDFIRSQCQTQNKPVIFIWLSYSSNIDSCATNLAKKFNFISPQFWLFTFFFVLIIEGGRMLIIPFHYTQYFIIRLTVFHLSWFVYHKFSSPRYEANLQQDEAKIEKNHKKEWRKIETPIKCTWPTMDAAIWEKSDGNTKPKYFKFARNGNVDVTLHIASHRINVTGDANTTVSAAMLRDSVAIIYCRVHICLLFRHWRWYRFRFLYGIVLLFCHGLSFFGKFSHSFVTSIAEFMRCWTFYAFAFDDLILSLILL